MITILAGQKYRWISPEIVEWLKQNVIPFETDDPNHSKDDLVCLKTIIGDARIVALGEATHGTREFFRMKHRILKFLTEEMEFNLFGIEATFPESILVNEYVHTGIGDPAQLLAGLYFWTWNTQEVLDMILWMRRHNADPDNVKKISFYGFDMQFPEKAMDYVINYLEKVDPIQAEKAAELYTPFRSYQDRTHEYRYAPDEVKAICQNNVREVYEILKDNNSLYEDISEPQEFAFSFQNARVVVQSEDYHSKRNPNQHVRDIYMAENANWLLEQFGPEAKVVLWAHNMHIEDIGSQKTMGSILKERYQDDLVICGFSFYKGYFNALSSNAPLLTYYAPAPLLNSYAYYFRSSYIPRFFLDLRYLEFDSNASEWLLGPLLWRSIGAYYYNNVPEYHFQSRHLPLEYDVIIYFQDTTASILLK
jgi:erythromycin esterase